MKDLLIVRDPTADDGTFGKLSYPGRFECYSAELPLRDVDGDGVTDKGASCIPAGTYVCRWTKSPTRKNADGSPEWTYRLEGVPGRDGILIHSGNFAGDKAKGYVADAEGCILLGRAILDVEIPQKRQPLLHRPECHHGKADHVDQGGTLSCRCICTCPRRTKQRGVSGSRDTVAAFAEQMNKEPFRLTIKWAPAPAPKEAA